MARFSGFDFFGLRSKPPERGADLLDQRGLEAAASAPASLFRRVHSVFFWALLVVTVPIWSTLALVACIVTLPFDRRRNAAHMIACSWGWFWTRFPPYWTIHVRGRKKLPWRGRGVIVANHLSILDIPLMLGLFRPFKWVAKQSTFRLPFLGNAMALIGYIEILRGDRGSVMKMLRDCRKWIEREVPVFLCPEGTRSKDGRLKPFKNGAFQLAVEMDCPVYPIAVWGTRRGLPKHGLLLQGTHMDVRVLDPVHPRDCDHDMDTLRETVREAIRLEVDRLRRLPLHAGTE